MQRKKTPLPPPTESEEQIELFKWASLRSGKYPMLELMYHIPNGGKRSASEAARFKKEGVKSGVSDICLPVARGGYHGLYIELKRIGEKASLEQKDWIKKVREQGYHAGVAWGWEEAANIIIDYLRKGKT